MNTRPTPRRKLGTPRPNPTHALPSPRLLPVAMACAALMHAPLMAQPVPTQLPVLRPGGAVINAQVGTATAGNNPSLAITQTPSAGNRGLIEWQSFSIGRNASVQISQPNAQSVLINRVTGDTGGRSASEIYGALSANGRVFLVNPAGIVFGPGAQVNVGALVATSLDLTEAMTADQYRGAIDGNGPIGLRLDGSAARVDVLDGARITAQEGGSVALIGSAGVRQHGVIEAARGRVQLAATDRAEAVLPLGTSGFVDLVLRPAAGGQVQVGGTVDVASTTAQGGEIALNADAVELTSGSVLNADGATGGGRILVGGDDTRDLHVRSGALLSADATTQGDGGEVTLKAMYRREGNVARSDFGVTEVYGDIRARGGVAGGNGGQVETSGVALNTSLRNNSTGVVSRGRVDAAARHNSGVNGTWTLDPYNVTIARNTTTTSVDGSFNPTATGAVINADDISAALNAGTNVVVTTGTANTGTEAGNIYIQNGTTISRTEGTGTATLTLQAHNDIAIDYASTLQGTPTAPLNVNLHADIDGQNGGSVQIYYSTIATGGGNIDIGGGNPQGSGRATGNGQLDGVAITGGTLDASGATARGDIAIRGGAQADSRTSGITIGGTLIGRNITLDGQGALGCGVCTMDYGGPILFDSNNGLIDIRGVAHGGTDTSGYGGTIVGVDLNRVDISLGSTASLRVAGRATDDIGMGDAAGVRYRDTNIVASPDSTGTITLAGELAGSSPGLGGLAYYNTESGGMTIHGGLDPITGEPRPTGANIVLGGSASLGDALALTDFSGYGFLAITSGLVNIRPLGVDVNGNLVEHPSTPISVTRGAFGFDSGMYVYPDLFGVDAGYEGGEPLRGIEAGGGIVVGSSFHTGRITANLSVGSLSLVLQNQGAGSEGIDLGYVDVRDLTLRTTGNVQQLHLVEAIGGISVSGQLIIETAPDSEVELHTYANHISNLSFDGPAFLNVDTETDLTIGTGTLWGYTPGIGFSQTAISRNVGGYAVGITSGGNIDVTAPINTTLPAPAADEPFGVFIGAAPTSTIRLGEGVTVTAPDGGVVQLWAGDIIAPQPNNQTPVTNLYGCDWTMSVTTCADDTVQVPTTGNLHLRATRPTINVTATASGTPEAPTYTLSTTSPLPNGDTLEGILSGSPTIAPSGAVTAQGTLTSPTGYIINFVPGSVSFAGGPPPTPALPNFTSQETRSGFLKDLHSDVYGRNLSSPFICTAASIIKDGVVVEQRADPLAAEWGKVRSQPQLSSCLDVTAGGQCSAF